MYGGRFMAYLDHGLDLRTGRVFSHTLRMAAVLLLSIANGIDEQNRYMGTQFKLFSDWRHGRLALRLTDSPNHPNYIQTPIKYQTL